LWIVDADAAAAAATRVEAPRERERERCPSLPAERRMKKCPSELELEAFLRCREDATAAAVAAGVQKPVHDVAALAPFAAGGVFPPSHLSAFSFADSVSRKQSNFDTA
jgi:hypothetical protein